MEIYRAQHTLGAYANYSYVPPPYQTNELFAYLEEPFEEAVGPDKLNRHMYRPTHIVGLVLGTTPPSSNLYMWQSSNWSQPRRGSCRYNRH